MGFTSALARLVEGYKIRRQKWEERDTVMLISQVPADVGGLTEPLMCLRKDGVVRPVVLVLEDVLATDWELAKEG